MCRAKTLDNAPHVDGLSECSLLAVAVLLLGPRTPLFGQQADPSPVSTVATVPDTTHVLGLENIKRGAKGRLAIASDTLRFDVGPATAEVSIASIQGVFTDQDSKQLVSGKKGAVARLAMPYGSGRVLSLVATQKVDVLTLEYRDSAGGLHGVILTLPEGQAPAVKGVVNREVEGKVRFFGGNLNATSDFAKKTAEIIREGTGQV